LAGKSECLSFIKRRKSAFFVPAKEYILRLDLFPSLRLISQATHFKIVSAVELSAATGPSHCFV
jgi:hypothetical protein